MKKPERKECEHHKNGRYEPHCSHCVRAVTHNQACDDWEKWLEEGKYKYYCSCGEEHESIELQRGKE